MNGYVLLSLFSVLTTSQFPHNIKWADITVKGSMTLDEFGDERATVQGAIQYNAMTETDNMMHTKLQVSLGLTVPLESWLTSSPSQVTIATMGTIPGLEGCQVIRLPASAVVCQNWLNRGNVVLSNHPCTRYTRDCQVNISEETLENHPELSMLVGAVTFVVYTEKDQPYLIQSNVTSVVDGTDFKTSVSLLVTDIGKEKPTPESLKLPDDCTSVTDN